MRDFRRLWSFQSLVFASSLTAVLPQSSQSYLDTDAAYHYALLRETVLQVIETAMSEALSAEPGAHTAHAAEQT